MLLNVLSCIPLATNLKQEEIFPQDLLTSVEDFPNAEQAILSRISPSCYNLSRHQSSLCETSTSPSIYEIMDAKLQPESDIPLPLNAEVQRWIDYFHLRFNSNFQDWIDRGNLYRPTIEQQLQKYDLPDELFHLAMIESGFNIKARSFRRATGMWQLMRSTARRFGLVVNGWLDERRDPELATEAACKLLSMLNQEFHDWHLSLAAYNAGEGKIRQAIKKAGTRDYWELITTKTLRKETKEFVPKFIAATLISKNPEEFGFQSDVVAPAALPSHKLLIEQNVTLEKLAKALQVSTSTLKKWNPALKKSKILASKKRPFALRIENDAVARCTLSLCRNENIM